MKREINSMIIEQIKLFNQLEESLCEQKKCVKENKLFELDRVGIKIDNICKNIAEIELKLRKSLGKDNIKDFVMKNNDKELYESYIFLVSQAEKLNLMKNDNQFLIKKSLSFINKLLSSINNTTNNKPNVYTRNITY